MGRGGSAVAAEDTIRLFRALRSIGVPFLAIDHVSKESKKNKDGGVVDAYGSIYTMNSARLAWHLTRSHTPDANTISMYAKNTKANHVSRQKSRMIEVKYINDERGVPRHIEITVSDDFGMVRESVSTHQRIMMLLGRGPLTYDEIAEELGVSKNAVQLVVSRDAKHTTPSFGKDKTDIPLRLCLTGGVTGTPDSSDEEGETQ
jgi:hypothetical protein